MGKVKYNDELLEYDDKWSFQSRPNRLSEIPDDTVVYASNFGQEVPDTQTFPLKMKGVRFYNCILDNCIIPEGNEVVGGSQRRYKAQNDRNDWEIDKDNKAVRPINYRIFEKLGLPIPDPKDIPEVATEDPVDLVSKAIATKP